MHQVLEEKLVKRQVSLKSLDDGKIEEASKGSARQKIAIRAGIDQEHAKRLNKFIKDLGLKGVSSQTQGEQLRIYRQEARRPPGRHRRVQGRRLRHPLAVQQLQGLTRPEDWPAGQVASACSSSRGALRSRRVRRS